MEYDTKQMENITCTVYIKIYIVFTIQIKTKNITMFDWL